MPPTLSRATFLRSQPVGLWRSLGLSFHSFAAAVQRTMLAVFDQYIVTHALTYIMVPNLGETTRGDDGGIKLATPPHQISISHFQAASPRSTPGSVTDLNSSNLSIRRVRVLHSSAILPCPGSMQARAHNLNPDPPPDTTGGRHERRPHLTNS